MKKLTISFLLIFTVSFLMAGTIEYTYYFHSPTVKESGNFQTITFENTFLTGKTGEPALPYQAIRLLLPPGEEAVAVTYSFENEEILEGDYLIYPQQPSQPYSIGSDGIFHQNREIYKSKNVYPSAAWGEYSTHFLNGHSFLLASFTPVKYIPSSGKVSFFRKITVTVETRSGERAVSALDNLNTSAKTVKQINAIAQNKSLLDTYPSKSSRDDEYQVLIIAPQSFTISLQQLQGLYLITGEEHMLNAMALVFRNDVIPDLVLQIHATALGSNSLDRNDFGFESPDEVKAL